MDIDERGCACAQLIVGALLIQQAETSTRQGRPLTLEWLQQRETFGSFYTLSQESTLRQNLFNKYLRIPIATYDFILERITLYIKKDTHLRQATPAGARLQATLLYLITGDYYSRLQHFTRIHESTSGNIIPEVR